MGQQMTHALLTYFCAFCGKKIVLGYLRKLKMIEHLRSASGESIIKEPSANLSRQVAGHHLRQKKFYRSNMPGTKP
jgi:hypothetical protein